MILALARPLLGKALLGVALLLALGGLWLRGEQYRSQRDKARDNMAALAASYTAAQAEAGRRAKAALAAAEQGYARKARESDREHRAATGDALRASERFIAANRLRPQVAGGPSCRSAAAAAGGGAGVPADLPADPVVLGAADVRACAEWVAYGMSARGWALGLAERPVGIPTGPPLEGSAVLPAK